MSTYNFYVLDLKVCVNNYLIESKHKSTLNLNSAEFTLTGILCTHYTKGAYDQTVKS